MKSYTKYLKIKKKKKIDIVNITKKVKKAVEESGIKEGFCLVNSMHITTSIFINNEEEGLKKILLIGWMNSSL